MSGLIVAQHRLGDNRHPLSEVVERLHLIRMEAMLVVVAAVEGERLVDIAKLLLQVDQHFRFAFRACSRLLRAIPVDAVGHNAPPLVPLWVSL